MNQQINVIGELPQGIIIHDLSFDWAGKRIAAACSDKTVRIYNKSLQGWIEQSYIKIQGASVWKVKWARPELGVILATCSLDRHVRIYEWKKVQKSDTQKNDWVSIHYFQENNTIQDIKFAPFKEFGLALAIVTADGYLKIIQPYDSMQPQKDWPRPCAIQISELGLNCLSWCKGILKDDLLLAIGCKNEDDAPRKVVAAQLNQKIKPFQVQNTIQFVLLNKEKQFVKTKQIIKQIKTIQDISWALINGRSYNLLGVGTELGVKIFQISLNSVLNSHSIEVLKQIKLSSSPAYRISWNVMGTYLSVSQRKKIRIWRSQARSHWKEIKQIEDS